MFKSVFAKYITTFMCIIFISFLILTLLIAIMVNNYAADAKREALTVTATNAADFLGDRMPANSTEKDGFARVVRTTTGVESVMNAISSAEDDVTLLVTDRDGNVLLVSGNESRVKEGGRVPRAVLDDVNSGTVVSGSQDLGDVISGAYFYCAAPVLASGNDEVCGTVFACSGSDRQDALLGVVIKTVIIGSLWIMLAALVAVYFITEKVIGPLRDMGEMARSFAAGNFEARVPVRGRDEVAELATAFNNMAGSLSQLETLRNTFMANVSHDLRTPMTTISGFIDNILSGAVPPEKQPYYLSLIRGEVQRLARLVASLLDISRIQAGDRKFEMKPFDVCEMARLILFSFEQKIEDKKLEVDFACDEERIVALADHDAIYQILYNICDNAVKFSREGGVLSVSLKNMDAKNPAENRVCVSVYNEGAGIAAEDLPFVFERFYKGDKSRGLDKSGVGLGLFIAKTIIDAHHEKIWVESEQGAWCRFSFTLTRANADEA